MLVVLVRSFLVTVTVGYNTQIMIWTKFYPIYIIEYPGY